MNDYIMAVKREKRDQVPENWKEIVEATDGAIAKAGFSPWRMQVNTTTEGAHQLQEKLGEYCHIEPVISHKF